MNTYTHKALEILDNIKTPTHFTVSSPSKITRAGNSAFSMLCGPEFGCPGATKACEKCYAQAKRHLFSNVLGALSRNWKLIKMYESNNDSTSAISSLLTMIPENADIFRIHESSDFFSQWYVDVWAKVIKERRNTYFWAYTRSFDFNYSALTRNKNFALWASTDNYNINEAKQFVRRYRKSGTKHALGPWDRNIKIPDSSFICPATNHKLDMNGACEKCMLCVVKKRTHKNVVFLNH